MNYQDFSVRVLKEASEIAERNFGKVAGTVKPEGVSHVLTETDLQIGRFIMKRIQENYPDYNIIDEEAGVIDNKSEYTWVVDPIDGTSNFAKGVPTYGIALGLLKDGEPIIGVIALPYFKEIYYAEKGKGAYCNEEKLQVSQEKELIHSLLAYGTDGRKDEPELTRKEFLIVGNLSANIRSLRASGSVFDFAMVAKGKYGAFLMRRGKIWDCVAAQVIIEEAGGVFTDFLGNKIDYSNALEKSDEDFSCCATTPLLHAQIQQIIHKDD